MSARRPRPILVTGSHRSGSTWVGKMIASHPRVSYVHEPFNPAYNPGCPVAHQWHHVTPADEERFIAYLRPWLEFHHSWWQDVRARPGPRRLAGATVRTLTAWKRRLLGWRPLLKDPIAFFSAEWLADAFGMDVVVVIRHPAAFASSVKRLGWTVRFDHLLEQPRLMQTLLAPFAGEVRRMAQSPPDVIDHAILFWRIVHQVTLDYTRRHPDWTFVRHEDLSQRPADEFRALFGRLGLDFPPCARRAVEEYTAEGNVREVANGVKTQLRRDSRANVWNWTHRLTPGEIARIRAGTEDLARALYPEAEWWAAAERQSA
jgi:hypothetical protein